MNLLFEQLRRVESELNDLRNTADQLSLTVSSLKTKIESRPEAAAPRPQAIPPALPEPVTMPDLAPVAPAPLVIPQTTANVTPASAPEPKVAAYSQTRDFEMQLGRVWSVRLGIVLLTTGFVFLSRYTYDNVIRDLGPGLRLTFMYLLSFLLTGAGLFCERWKESLKSYGRIVAAGGLSAIYYCGFAAHNVESLKIIESPVVASLLLLVSAGLFCAVSLWRESKVMLSASLALAFYSISVNPIGWMACFSALILAALGIAMMIRHRWVEVGFLVLAGSYLSYLWWQFAVHSADPSISHWFLPAYWLLFAAASLSPGRILDPQKHLLFTSLNNAAFFLLFSFRLDQGTWMDRHWLFCFVFGGALIALFHLGRKSFPEKSRLLHLVKGVSVITLGLSLLLNGPQLLVALLLEALVLMIVSLRFPHPLTIASSWIVAILSLLPLHNIPFSPVHFSVWLIGVAGWIAIGILHRRIDRAKGLPIHPGAVIASIIALLLIATGLMMNWTPWHRALGLAGLGAITAALSLLPRCQKEAPEALGVFLFGAFLALGSLPGDSSGSLLHHLTAAVLAILTSIPLAIHTLRTSPDNERSALHLITALFLGLSLPMIFISIGRANLPTLPTLITILALPILGTLIANRSKLLAHSIVPFLMYFSLLEVGSISAPYCFFIALITAGHFVLLQKHHRLPDRETLQSLLFPLISLFWGLGLSQSLDSPGLPLALTSVALFIGSPWFGKKLTPLVAAPFFLFGVLQASLHGSPPEVYLSLFSLLSLHLFRTFKESGDSLNILTVVALLGLWGQITLDAGSVPLAAAWALNGTALLLIGLGLKSRCFRLIGLIVLAFSLGHLMGIDVVKLDPLPRILSFMTLGLGLLGLGFVYNRWQDRLKQIL